MSVMLRASTRVNKQMNSPQSKENGNEHPGLCCGYGELPMQVPSSPEKRPAASLLKVKLQLNLAITRLTFVSLTLLSSQRFKGYVTNKERIVTAT
jgi:hypothetical protein